MDHFYVVYDFSKSNAVFLVMFRIFVPLFFTYVGIASFFYYKKFGEKSSTSNIDVKKFEYSRKQGMIVAILCTCFAGLISLIAIPSMVGEYLKTKKTFDTGQYQTVEGKVEHYHPMSANGQGKEKFDVAGVHFEFEDADLSDLGYKNAASHGGVIQEDLYVRIGYLNNG